MRSARQPRPGRSFASCERVVVRLVRDERVRAGARLRRLDVFWPGPSRRVTVSLRPTKRSYPEANAASRRESRELISASRRH